MTKRRTAPPKRLQPSIDHDERSHPDEIIHAERAYAKAEQEKPTLSGLLRHLHEQTTNPLYVWEAIAAGAKTDEPIPDWCLPYLREAAKNLVKLTRSVPNRERRRKEDPSSSKADPLARRALQSVPKALLLSKQGKNRFSSRATDLLHMSLTKEYFFAKHSHELSKELYRSGFDKKSPPEFLKEDIFRVERRGAQRIISSVKKLLATRPKAVKLPP